MKSKPNLNHLLFLKKLLIFAIVFLFFGAKIGEAKSEDMVAIGQFHNNNLYNHFQTKIETVITSLKDSKGVELLPDGSKPYSKKGNHQSIEVSDVQLTEGEEYTLTFTSTNTGNSERFNPFVKDDRGYLFLLINDDIELEKVGKAGVAEFLRNKPIKDIERTFRASASSTQPDKLVFRTILLYDGYGLTYDVENEFIFDIKPNEVTVSLKKQLGENESLSVNFADGTTSKKITKGSKLNFSSLPSLVEEDYTFLGWFKEGEDTGFNFEQAISEDITLVAKFSPKLKLQYEPQADNVTIFYKEDIKSANDYIKNIDSIPANIIKELNFVGAAPKNTTTDSQNITIRVTYTDDSFDDVSFNFTVKPLSEKFTPKTKTDVALFWGEDLENEASSYISNLSELGENPVVAYKNPVNSTKVDKNTLIVPISVTYEDKSQDEVGLSIQIKLLNEKYSLVAKDEISQTVGSPALLPADFIKNSKEGEALPKNTNFSFSSNFDWNKVGKQTAKVLITFEDKSTSEIEVSLNLKSRADLIYYLFDQEINAPNKAENAEVSTTTNEVAKEEPKNENPENEADSDNQAEPISENNKSESPDKNVKEDTTLDSEENTSSSNSNEDELEVTEEPTARGEANLNSDSTSKKKTKKSSSLSGNRGKSKQSSTISTLQKSILAKTGGLHSQVSLYLSLILSLLTILGGLSFMSKKAK